MIKVFISQPMNGISENEILKRREELKKAAEEELRYKGYTDSLYFIDSFILGAEKVNPLFCLGYAITSLSQADIAFFSKDWKQSRGCIIEKECCFRYNIPILI